MQVINQGKAQDILALMEGESPYITESSEGAPTDHKLIQLWTFALYHLRFISEFGINGKKQFKDGKVICPFPNEFMQWLEADAPGIDLPDLNRYLIDNPIEIV